MLNANIEMYDLYNFLQEKLVLSNDGVSVLEKVGILYLNPNITKVIAEYLHSLYLRHSFTAVMQLLSYRTEVPYVELASSKKTSDAVAKKRAGLISVLMNRAGLSYPLALIKTHSVYDGVTMLAAALVMNFHGFGFIGRNAGYYQFPHHPPIWGKIFSYCSLLLSENNPASDWVRLGFVVGRSILLRPLLEYTQKGVTINKEKAKPFLMAAENCQNRDDLAELVASEYRKGNTYKFHEIICGLHKRFSGKSEPAVLSNTCVLM